MVDILCNNGADINIQNNIGQTPLIKAIVRNKIIKINYFLELNADISIADNDGKTALHYAAINGYSEIVDLLVSKGADINAKDKKDRTPAFYAVYHGNDKIADNLFKKGASKKNMPHKKANLLDNKSNEGEATIWYLNHSGWAIKTKNHLLIFDYWHRDGAPDNPNINNGRINPEEIVSENVIVFSSHSHSDHYSPEMFEWNKDVKNINYVLGFETDLYDDYTYMSPREEQTIDNVKITAIYSTDSGVGFLVEVDGLTIYHPGDHANRYRCGDKEFTDEIDFLAEQYSDIDIAFLPITGCSFKDKVALFEGNDYVVDKLNPSLALAQHGSGNEHKYKEYAEEKNNPIYKYVSNKGDRLIYKKKNSK